MDPFRNKVLAGNQFDGLAADTGLFLPEKTGDGRQQIFINSLKFHTTGGGTTFTLSCVDPTDPSNETIILTDTADDVYLTGLLLTKEEDRASWGLKFVTAGMTNDGFLTIDSDGKMTEQ